MARCSDGERHVSVRFHGRGGQGVVTAAEMLSVAAFDEGRHAQDFPSFASERTGAPVVAFWRIDDKEIRLCEPIVTPDAVIIQDPTLLHQVDCFAGLQHDGYILINTGKSFAARSNGQSGFNHQACRGRPDHDRENGARRKRLPAADGRIRNARCRCGTITMVPEEI